METELSLPVLLDRGENLLVVRVYNRAGMDGQTTIQVTRNVQEAIGVAGLERAYANSWALVIGINAYKRAPPLSYAVADAKRVASVLPRLGFPPENIRVLLDGDATKERIEKVLYQELVAMGRSDRLLVYFAGHGHTFPIKGGEEGYFLPVNADPASLPKTAIPMQDVKQIGQRVRAKHVLFVFDACFAGFAVTRDIVVQPNAETIGAALREDVVQVLTAGGKGEKAIEEGGHGVFTKRLLEALAGGADPSGRGVLTAAQLGAWIAKTVKEDSAGKMTPRYSKLYGDGDFLFVLPRPCGSCQVE